MSPCACAVLSRDTPSREDLGHEGTGRHLEEFQHDAVELAQAAGQTIGSMVKELRAKPRERVGARSNSRHSARKLCLGRLAQDQVMEQM